MTRILLIETSARSAQVALADGPHLLTQRRLDDSRRNARDLVPTIGDLLRAQDWKPADLAVIAVGLGPGSYTGLRVGLMTAKALAFATGCTLLGLETFAIIAQQVPAACQCVDVVADAQKESVYVQPFQREGEQMVPMGPLEVRPAAEWLAGRRAEAWASGPGLRPYTARLEGVSLMPEELRLPGSEAMLGLALRRLDAGEGDDVMGLVPLYARPSSAEQQWTRLGR